MPSALDDRFNSLDSIITDRQSIDCLSVAPRGFLVRAGVVLRASPDRKVTARRMFGRRCSNRASCGLFVFFGSFDAPTRGDETMTNQLLYWISEREAIRIRRANGEPPPWTKDEILRDWSFCNVRREADRTTRWIADNWRAPHAHDPDLWFAMVVARFVNWPDTLAALGYPTPWDPDHFLKVLNTRKENGEVCFGPAYNISNGGKTTAKAEHFVQQVFAPLWGPLTRKRLRPRDDDTLHSFYGRLTAMPGFGSFMAGQVVADMMYVPPLKHAPDWMTFAVPGPDRNEGLIAF